VLRQMLRALEKADTSQREKKYSVTVKSLLVAEFLTVLFFGRYLVGWYLLVFIIFSTFIGSALAIVIVRRQAKARMPYLMPHINIESMRSRLTELAPKWVLTQRDAASLHSWCENVSFLNLWPGVQIVIKHRIGGSCSNSTRLD